MACRLRATRSDGRERAPAGLSISAGHRSGVAAEGSWRGRPPPPEQAFPRERLRGPADRVARALLGARLVSEVGGERAAGVIVEAEAYLGLEDPASHAAARIGRTRRNASMFGPAGHAYVYLIYGMHWCMNVVTAREDDPSAVLLRALEPVEGLDVMSRRRGGRRQIASGPGRLGQAMGIDGSLDGHDLAHPPLRLLLGWDVDPSEVGASPRIGVARARDWPLRYYLRANVHVSGRPR